MTLDIFYPLEQIQRIDRSTVGNTAFYLGLLSQQNYPVLPGVVLPAPCFRQFLEGINWLEPLFADLPNSSLHLNVDNFEQLQTIAQQLRRAIQSTPLPLDWQSAFTRLADQWDTPALIVRPSVALTSPADTLLSVQSQGVLSSQICPCQPEAIANAVKQVWAEVFRARSLVYWQRSGIEPQQIQFAVLIQPIHSAITSGHLTIHPDAIDLYAAYGLGLGITDGYVMPDWYHLQRQTGHIQDRRLGSKTYAYQVAASPITRPLHEVLNGVVSLTLTSSCLQAMLVNQQYRQQFCLTDAQLQHLGQLAEQVVTTFDTTVYLEWTIPPAQSNEPTIPYITQAIPQFYPPPPVMPAEVRDNPAFFSDLRERSPVTTLADQWVRPSTSDLLQGIPGAGGRVLGSAWVVRQWAMAPLEIPDGVVLVAPTITPEQVARLSRVAAIVTTQGGMTSHGAIVARELRIPAVMGVMAALDQIQTGDVLLVDGDRGIVQRLQERSHLAEDPPTDGSQVLANPSDPTIGPDRLWRDRPIATQLLLNLNSVDAIETFAQLPVDGIGLLRSELLLLHTLGERSPSTWIDRRDEIIECLSHYVGRVVAAFAPRPVIYRSLDLRSQDLQPHDRRGLLAEPNPTLGLHGTLSYQLDTRLFDAELQALRQVQQAGHHNFYLMLPFVRTVEEFQFCRDRVVETNLATDPNFQLWIMAEVPSVLFLLPDYVQAGVQGISIGSNDLTQLLLAVDRDQAQMSAFFERYHPAVLRALRQLIQTARQQGIPCSICGNIPTQDPALIEQLVRWGISSISVSPDQVQYTHQAIQRAEHRLLIETLQQFSP